MPSLLLMNTPPYLLNYVVHFIAHTLSISLTEGKRRSLILRDSILANTFMRAAIVDCGTCPDFPHEPGGHGVNPFSGGNSVRLSRMDWRDSDRSLVDRRPD
ncbi:hypothetical protein OIU84_023508 [Salix udensis]|uniref:Uncharacterized protein n=1 Tax=Salix udensis TaxID=889485 RepID=A0AAD6KSG0_9ROSI|nr:hypothetical protein OIU84_023508 [Salix udensis]